MMEAAEKPSRISGSATKKLGIFTDCFLGADQLWFIQA
jgi:hypothetical protein